MAILPLLFCACSSFNEENSTLIITTTPDLQAGFADDTRTYVENNKYLRWHEDDRLTAFYGNTLNRQYKFNGKTGANSGTFSLVPSGELGTGNAFDRIYAVYPYNETATITEEGEISLSLPTTQLYAESSFGKGANTMVAVTENLEDTFLAFKNACGYLKLELYGDNVTIANIEIKGNNGEKIAGAATATIAFGEAPVLTMADDATTTVTIDCSEGVTLGTTAETATEFWVVLPETTFTKGLTIKATSTAGGVFEKSTANEVVITRNEILPMAALAVEFPVVIPTIPNNEIWYTATAKVEPLNNFNATIVSNEWDETTGKGIIIFDKDITLFGDQAFFGCANLTSIIIPDSVTSFGQVVFYNCTNLKSVTIPKGITSFNTPVFNNCSSLKEVYYKGDLSAWCKISFNNAYENSNPLYYGAKLFINNMEMSEITIPSDITEIKSYAFIGCSSLTSVTIPDTVTLIGDYSFSMCSNLISITIPNSVASIGACAFSSCSSLKNITIPNRIKVIGNYTFNYCSSLKSIIIPDSVTSVGNNAFRMCSSLTSVTIGNGVTSIGNSVFDNCTSLKEVNCKPTTPPSIGTFIFNNTASDLRIYVPMASVSAYKSKQYWSFYADYIEGKEF